MAKKNEKADKPAGGKGGSKGSATGKADRPAEAKPAEKAGKGEGGQGKGGKAAAAKADKVEKSTEKAPELTGAKEGDKPTESLAARVVEGVKNVAHAIAEKLGVGGDGAPATEPAGKRRGFRRRMVGRVTSDKMDKTVTVEVIRDALDPVYKKYVRRRERYKAHDEKNQYKVGDRVEITEHRPISRDKRWLVTRLVNRAVEE